MIKIIKSEAPEKLMKNGSVQTKIDRDEYLKNKLKYDSGELKFEALSTIYNSDIVRETLDCIQKNKCCYCETKSTRSNSDVEHFRPKAAYSSVFKGKSMYPGYFWLAYDWDNLFLACQVCNQIFKNDFFPIVDENTRAQVNDFNIRNESSLFIHPSNDDPENEIEYRESIPFGKTEKGKKTIAYLGFGSLEHGKEFGIDYSKKHKIRINRLFEEREIYYQEKAKIYQTIKLLEKKGELDFEGIEVLNGLKNIINNAQQEHSEWSSMIKCAVKNEFKEY
ncbi:hypothetical protein N4T20_04835 [Flavobacterium sp. TR2]|uniref:hypothetical protein n=1 Tax=Flavobacterium sp. TR2 TaxID=2977321 RepID=UPI0021B15186|nr:hypothetical protein [Flavobacterium sp. TR2]UWY29258.1 hypothetical protein N4T20_04835 [Flavobacterium sp. TR2]